MITTFNYLKQVIKHETKPMIISDKGVWCDSGDCCDFYFSIINNTLKVELESNCCINTYLNEETDLFDEDKTYFFLNLAVNQDGMYLTHNANMISITSSLNEDDCIGFVYDNEQDARKALAIIHEQYLNF